MPQSAEATSRAIFEQRFGAAPDAVAVAPGRVNLIGDHTDYNDGFVLPMAIDRALAVAFRRRPDRIVRVVSDGDEATFDLDDLAHGDPSWSEYLRGVAWAYPAARRSAGWDGVIASSIPAGAGLSSSAALEIATAMVFDHGAGASTARTEMALAAQRAEQQWVGTACGIMDQLTVATGRAGHALLLDCRTLEVQHVPLPDDVAFVVLDTSTRRELTTSLYNDRRAACERVADRFGVPALRDLSLEDLVARWADLDSVDARRARHVLTENRRVIDAAAALAAGDVARFGSLMVESHASLRDDYESSSDELDAIVEAALESPGCVGARVTGAGFAGCAVAAVAAGDLDAFMVEAADTFARMTGLEPELYPCAPSGPARLAQW